MKGENKVEDDVLDGKNEVVQSFQDHHASSINLCRLSFLSAQPLTHWVNSGELCNLSLRQFSFL